MSYLLPNQEFIGLNQMAAFILYSQYSSSLHFNKATSELDVNNDLPTLTLKELYSIRLKMAA